MLSVITWRKKKTAKESEAYLIAARETQGAIRQVYASMELPQDAVPMDVFYYGYKAKKDKLVPYAKGVSMYVYDNKVVRVYRQADTLCIADKEGVIPVSLQEISSIKTINLGDLRLGIFNKNGSVDAITIGGENVTSEGWYRQEAPVIITYHGFPDQRF